MGMVGRRRRDLIDVQFGLGVEEMVLSKQASERGMRLKARLLQQCLLLWERVTARVRDCNSRILECELLFADSHRMHRALF